MVVNVRIFKLIIVYWRGPRFHEYHEVSYHISEDGILKIFEDGKPVGIFHSEWAIELGDAYPIQ